MRLFGFEITLRKAAQNLQSVTSQYGGPGASWGGLGNAGLSYWGGPIRESFAGAWQKGISVDSQTSILAFSAVFACVTGIASDIGKMRIKLDRKTNDIWTEITEQSPWLPVLRKPNHYQTRITFLEQWIASKLLWGNTYIWKERDNRGIVTALYILHPWRVHTLVADDGSVFYRLDMDHLSQIQEGIIVPASEIIHDVMCPLWHPLIGVSPIYACGRSATMGNKIQNNSTNFFGNKSLPGGQLTAPGTISKDTADRLKAQFEQNFSGENVGRLFVSGDGLKFEAFTMPAEQAQLIEQLKWTVEDVARSFHYPLFKLGGPLPPYAGNVEALIQSYYTDCLQELVESIELLLDEGLALPPDMGTELDLDNLFRMDTTALFESNNKAVAGGWMAPNEARFRANLEDVSGGESPMIQQQNYSLAALAKRDAQADPFAAGKTAPPPAPPPPPAKEFELDADELEALYGAEVRKEFALT